MMGPAHASGKRAARGAPAVAGRRGSTQGVRNPSVRRERNLWRSGHTLVAGVDEVGRGAWAGPLTVGVAVVAATGRRFPKGLRDSKMLSEPERERLYRPVAAWCAAWAVADATSEECDRLGMTAALRLAAARAFASLPVELLPDAVVLDGNFDYVSPVPTRDEGRLRLADGAAWDPSVSAVVDGDADCASVAAASVLAKVTRDRHMRAVADSYPPFDFDRNKGYPSPTHRLALRGYGPTALHRCTWASVAELPWRGFSHPVRAKAPSEDRAPAPR